MGTVSQASRARRRCTATRSRAFASLALVGMSLVASRASADVETNEERAERFFKEAEKKFDSGDVAGACAQWAESLRLTPKLGTLLNLALCHEQQGKVATAWTEFHRGAAWAAQIGQRDRQEFAHQHAIVLEKKLPRISLQLPRAREIGTLEVDGEPLPEADWYLPIYLDPGDHTIAVSAPGKVRRVIGVSVLPWASSQAVTIAPLEDEPLPPPPPPKKKPKVGRPWKRIVGMGLVGAGSVAAAAGAYYSINAASTGSNATTSEIVLGAGLAAALSGGLLLFFATDSSPPVSLAPSVGARYGGLSAALRF
jgi:hypothetical protein